MTCHDRHNFREVVVSGSSRGHNVRHVVPIVDAAPILRRAAAALGCREERNVSEVAP